MPPISLGEYDVSQKGYYYEDETFILPMVYLSSEEASSLLFARKMLQDVSGGNLGDGISSILEKITNVLNKHMATGDQVDDDFSFHLIKYSPVTEAWMEILKHGDMVEVIKHKGLRNLIRTETEKITQIY